jgi:hypothetical protein
MGHGKQHENPTLHEAYLLTAIAQWCLTLHNLVIDRDITNQLPRRNPGD